MRQRIQRAFERARRTTTSRVLIAFGESQASNFAAALAFSALLAVFPTMLGVLAVIGLAVRDQATEAHFQVLIVQTFPGAAQPELRSALHGVRQSAGWLGFISIGGLIWSASSIFSTMEFALTQIFGTRQRDLLRQKLMGLVMMLLLVAAAVLMVAANSAAALAANVAPHYVPVAWMASLFVGAIVMVGLLVLIYRFVPNRTFTLREVLPGALLAGLLIEVLSLAFPIYARYTGGFNTYGAQFGLFFLLATWLYLLSELLLLGAVYNRFRIGRPFKEGLIASPMADSRAGQQPVEPIEDQRDEVLSEAATAPPARRGRPRPRFVRAALGLVFAIAIAGRAARRAARRTIAI